MSHNIIYLTNPQFIEKLHHFIPSKIDRALETEALGRNLVGYEDLADFRTNEETQNMRKEFIQTMNLGQASKHFEFLLEESSKFFDGFKSGD